MEVTPPSVGLAVSKSASTSISPLAEVLNSGEGGAVVCVAIVGIGTPGKDAVGAERFMEGAGVPVLLTFP